MISANLPVIVVVSTVNVSVVLAAIAANFVTSTVASLTTIVKALPDSVMPSSAAIVLSLTVPVIFPVVALEMVFKSVTEVPPPVIVTVSVPAKPAS